MFKNYKNKKVLITGHTGFKGSWLTIWLNKLGAKVYGISLDVPSNPSNFKINSVKSFSKNYNFDICNYIKLKSTINKIKPDYIFHLAAQALVKKSYQNPKLTFETNSIGTLNILESLKELKIKKKCSLVIITSDKSYKNLEIERGYVEGDLIGGHDPYSASKACAELIIQSYLKSYFNKKTNIRVAIARAGNVIGGGDWSENRLIPDIIRSYSKKKTLEIRNPNSTRPWQHVLEALAGYLILGKKLHNSKNFHSEIFNFGPSIKNSLSVLGLIKIIKKSFKGLKWKIKISKKHYESKLLSLNSKKAYKRLNWKCVLLTNETINFVTDWYQAYYKKNINMHQISINQIEEYTKIMKKKL